MTNDRPERTLFLLVTCSRDPSRRDLAVAVTKNVTGLLERLGLVDRLVVFDNASTFPDHLDMLPNGVRVCRASENVGYWTAIKWVLDNIGSLAPFGPEFLYIIESDLTHSDFAPLGRCEALLDAEPRASAVRTQEFSVRWRWRFEKRLRYLPFHIERSQVALENAVTGERATFKPVAGIAGLYLSNLHPKLPALNRVDLLKTVFERLAAMDGFSEADFFAEAMKIKPMIGVLDGGIFHSLASWSDRATVVSGSYGSAKQLAEAGYHNTRQAQIVPVADDLVDVRIAGQ